MTRHGSSGSRKGIGGGCNGGWLLLSCFLLPPLEAFARTTMHELASTYRGGWIQDGVMFDVRAIATAGNSSGAAAPDGVTVFGLDILTPETSKFCVELYTKAGGFASAASNPSAWTFLGSFALDGRGPNTPTEIPVGAFDPVAIGMGETQAFYVTTQNEKLRYTALSDGAKTGDVYVSSEVYFAGAGEEVRNRGGGRNHGEARGRNLGQNHDNDSRTLDANSAAAIVHDDYNAYSGNARSLQGNEGLSVQILTGVAKNYPFAESWPHRVFNGALLYTVGREASTGILTAEQLAAAQATRRGLATCDEPAIPPTPPPSTSPILPPQVPVSKTPTASPVKNPTGSPSGAPTSAPTVEPTTLESTIRKVATTLHGGLKQSGCMFDIRVPSVEEGGPPEGITVIAIEISTALKEEVCIEVYTKEGTYVGFEEDVTQGEDGSWSSPTWSILGASTVEGRGEREPTQLPIGHLDPVFVSPGERRAFYVTLTEPEMRYTEPKYGEESGELFSGSPLGHMELMVGAAVAYPFEEAWQDRIFNGAVVYALGDVGDGVYSEMGEADRERACPRPTDVPTEGPSKGPTDWPTKTPTKVPSKGPSLSPVAATSVTAPISAAPTKDAAAKAAPAKPPAPALAPTITTESPVAKVDTSLEQPVDGAGDSIDTVPAPPALAKPTLFPTFDIVKSLPTFAPGNSDAARLAGSCPAAASGASKDIEVGYEYSVIVDEDADVWAIVTGMENELHRSLMEDMCSDGRRKQARARGLQTVVYQGFNSNPEDYASQTGCGDSMTVTNDQACYVVTGGVTAIVEEDVDEGVVMQDMGSYSEGVISDPYRYEKLGVQGVAFNIDSGTATDDGQNLDEDGTDGGHQDATAEVEGDPNLVGSVNKGGNDGTAPDEGGPTMGLSTMGIVIIGVLAGTLGVVVIALLAVYLRKRRKHRRSNSQELFREFPDEEERVYRTSPGDSSGYDQSHVSGGSGSRYITAPLYTGSSGSLPPPPAMPPPALSTVGSGSGSSAGSSPAVILNELEEVSLVSNDRSKSRFAASAIAASRTASSGRSVGSRGSNDSGKKSVEFVRAGQSFSSRQSNQPEDTVDL